MKITKILIVVMLAVALLGCGKHEPRHIIILPDVSGSIDRESLDQAFKAINELTDHLQRGDMLTIIPILGDAEAEASGKILRFEAPANRQAYDMDLRNFRGRLNSSLNEMEKNAIVHPGLKTDVLGSIALAQQEFRTDSRPIRVLLILSDFLEEDHTVNFRTDHRLNDFFSAQKFATSEAELEQINLGHVTIHLGLLRSHEFRALRESRRNALKAFWLTYLSLAGANVDFTIDGVGVLK